MIEKIFRFSQTLEMHLPPGFGIVIGAPDILRPEVNQWLSEIISKRKHSVKSNFFCGRYVFPGETLSKESTDTYNRVCQIPLPPSDSYMSRSGNAYSFPTARLIAAAVPFRKMAEAENDYNNRIVIRPDADPAWFYLEKETGGPKYQHCKARITYDNGNVIVRTAWHVVETISIGEVI